MSLQCLVASANYIKMNSPIIPAMPWTVGMWIWFPANPSATQAFWGMSIEGVGTAFLLALEAGPVVTFYYFTGGSPDISVSTGAGMVPAAGWNYVLFRAISSTNRRWAIRSQTQYNAGQITTSVAQGAFNRIDLGTCDGDTVGAFYTGNVAEYFLASADIYPNGGAIDQALVEKIAYRGPFSEPSIAPSILDYASLRTGPVMGEGDIYGRGHRTWSPTASPKAGAHPPLYGDYVRPNQSKRLLFV